MKREGGKGDYPLPSLRGDDIQGLYEVKLVILAYLRIILLNYIMYGITILNVPPVVHLPILDDRGRLLQYTKYFGWPENSRLDWST